CTPCAASQSAICSKSDVKQSKHRTGCSSLSGLIATQCSLPPISMPAASGCITSNAFQSTFGEAACFFPCLALPASMDCTSVNSLGPAPMKYKTLQRGHTCGICAARRYQCKGSEETGTTLKLGYQTPV